MSERRASSMERKILYGLLGVVGILVTDGFGFPLVNHFSQFSVAAILISRGIMTAAVPFFLPIKPWGKPSWHTIASAWWLGVVAFAIFTAFRAWGVSLTMTIFSTTALVNFFFAWRERRLVSVKPFVATLFIVAGVIIVLKPWVGGIFQLSGFLWSMAGVFAGAFFYEAMNRSDDTTSVKLFWQGIAMVFVGGARGAFPEFAVIARDISSLFSLLGVGFFIGFLNLFSNVKAIEYLDPAIVSAFVPIGTVVAIAVSGFLLGERLDFMQWAGILIILASAEYIRRWLSSV